MNNSRDRLQGAFSLDTRLAQRLRQACPDLDDWPRSWQVAPADIVVGRQIVEVLTPLLIHLPAQRLAKATFSRHRDKLWTLGDELILYRYDDDVLAKKHVKDALRKLTQDDGGPPM